MNLFFRPGEKVTFGVQKCKNPLFHQKVESANFKNLAENATFCDFHDFDPPKWPQNVAFISILAQGAEKSRFPRNSVIFL